MVVTDTNLQLSFLHTCLDNVPLQRASVFIALIVLPLLDSSIQESNEHRDNYNHMDRLDSQAWMLPVNKRSSNTSFFNLCCCFFSFFCNLHGGLDVHSIVDLYKN